MNSKRFAYRAIVLVMGMVFLAAPSTASASEDHHPQKARVFPPELVVYGMTYGDWAAASWQQLFSLPVSSIPSLTGTNCLIGQENGPVFFAPAALGAPLTISCTIPAGKAIFITLLSPECSTLEPPPYNGSNPQELRNCAGGHADGIDPDTLELTVDNKRVVRDFRRFRVQTPSFEFVMPASDNLLQLPGVTTGTSVADGYFVMLRPLPEGQHVIRFGGSFTSGPSAGFSATTTLNLTVE
jgi:hypothetical protein